MEVGFTHSTVEKVFARTQYYGKLLSKNLRRNFAKDKEANVLSTHECTSGTRLCWQVVERSSISHLSHTFCDEILRKTRRGKAFWTDVYLDILEVQNDFARTQYCGKSLSRN